jgi:hypothetical protein
MRIPYRDSRTIQAEFDVWLSRELIFNRPPGYNIKKYPKFYKAKKIKYTGSVLKYLDRMENKGLGDRGRAVAIFLDGMIRYVWRSDVLSRKEYDEIQRNGMGVLRSKLRRDVDKKSVE